MVKVVHALLELSLHCQSHWHCKCSRPIVRYCVKDEGLPVCVDCCTHFVALLWNRHTQSITPTMTNTMMTVPAAVGRAMTSIFCWSVSMFGAAEHSTAGGGVIVTEEEEEEEREEEEGSGVGEEVGRM